MIFKYHFRKQKNVLNREATNKSMLIQREIQKSEAQEKFKRYVAPLFKAKRAICECLTVDGAREVINKNDRKTFYVEGMELKPICEMTSNGMMQWSPTVVKEVRDRYAELTASR